MSLSAGEVEEYRRTFNEFDKDGDGRITKEELKKVLAVVNPDISDINVDSIISAVDNNNDGCLDFNEFLNLVKPPVSLDDQKKEILSAFRYDQI
jgi:Ca2+-binding EF-hand superfamily protein